MFGEVIVWGATEGTAGTEANPGSRWCRTFPHRWCQAAAEGKGYSEEGGNGLHHSGISTAVQNM